MQQDIGPQIDQGAAAAMKDTGFTDVGADTSP
jgi:hypothetical protein